MRMRSTAVILVLLGCSAKPNPMVGSTDAGSNSPGGDAGSSDAGATTGDGPNTSCTVTGFAATPTSFALPPGYGPLAFQSTARAASCGTNNVPGYALVDLTGHGKPDLVVTYSCSDATVGDSRWLIYPS